MRKHTTQLSELIEKQKSDHERLRSEYLQKLAKEERARKEKSEAEDNKRYMQAKMNSCDNITTTAAFLALKAMQDSDSEDVSGCFGKSSSPKSSKTPMSPTRRKQALLDPIRRWNSFHSRDKRSSASVARSFEQFRRDYAKKMVACDVDIPANASITATGLMGALPRVVALRNESLPQEDVVSDPSSKLTKTPTKDSLSVGRGFPEKMRTLSHGDVSATFEGKKWDSGIKLMQQISRERLLAEREEQTKQRRWSDRDEDTIQADDKCREIASSTPENQGKLTKQKTKEKVSKEKGETIKFRRWSDKDENESLAEDEKIKNENLKKLIRRKTKEKLIVEREATEKARKWSDKDEEDEKLKVEIDDNSTCVVGLTSSEVEDDDGDQICFGKRSGGSARRPNECFVLEPSDMIAIDYPEGQTLQQSRRLNMDRGVNLVFDDNFTQNRPELYQKSNRSSHSSDTSSAYSGSDTMTSVQSSLDADEVDLSGLVESIVDSDEEDLAESIDSLTVRDHVRECLEKDPSDRTEQDIEILLELTQHLKAFTNMTLAVRRALCQVMVFAVVEKAGTIVMNDGEELDSWSVLINGHVEVEHSNGEVEQLHLGDSFGILPTMEKLYHRGVMRTKCDDCQFVCITQTDYYRIQHQGEENTKRHEENGRLVMVTEQRGGTDVPSRRGHIVIRGTPERLMLQLIEENSIDPTYVEDFLLTHRTFIDNSIDVANQLLEWFQEPSVRDRVTRVVLLWVNNHFTDFETDPAMMEFLETFEAGLEREKMQGQLRLLNIACAAKARTRNVTLARPCRDQVLNFSILGGYEKGFGIFISKVEKKSKAEQVGLKRGDQILEVNGQSFEHVTHVRALEILRGTTHLSITVKSNLLAFKEMLSTPDNSPRPRGRKVSEIAKLQTDPRARHSTSTDPRDNQTHSNENNTIVSASPMKDKAHKGFMTLAPKKRLQKALMKMNILPKNTINECTSDENVVDSNSSETTLYHSQSNQDLYNLYDDVRAVDYPEHVLKVYKPDQTCKYLLVHKETTAHEVVMLALQEFGITDPSSRFSLCEVSVAEGGIIKQRRLPDQLQNLAERIGLSSRYYLKTNGVSETLVADEMAPELIRESHVHFLQLNAIEVAIQLTLQDFSIFRQIESTEYVDDLFQLKSRYGVPMLTQFAELVNREMFWVVTEVCSEHNLVRRSKIIKQFIKVARQCKECKNFNSMFAIVSGLGHGAVSRLRLSWEKLPSKYQRLFSDLQDLMDPSRNMSKYRQLISSEVSQPPIIPFYPVVKKDLTFIHLGNDSRVESLINFEKLRMIAKEVRQLTNMCSSPYDLLTMLELGGQPPSNAMFALNQMTTGSGPTQTNSATVKRRKKSTAAPNPKKMFEEAQMVRRVKAYLNNMKVTTDEEKLHQLSLDCEPAGSAPNSAPVRKRHPSPTLSTTSSASSASEGKKGVPKFGTASPQAVRKMLALSESNKTRPHCPRHPVPQLPLPGLALHHPTLSPSPSPGSHRRVGSVVVGMPSVGHGGRAMHERSHSDTPTLPLPVHLSAESSSVTSLSNLPLRKTVTSGSVTSSDSGHSTQLDSHSGSSVEVQHGGHSPVQPRRHSALQPGSMDYRLARTFPHGIGVPVLPINGVGMMPPPPPRARHPPAYSVAAQMARLHKLGRAHSHEGVTGYYHTDPEEDDDEDAQVSAV